MHAVARPPVPTSDFLTIDPYDLDQADFYTSDIIFHPLPTAEERERMLHAVSATWANRPEVNIGMSLLPESGILVFWGPASDWLDYPRCDVTFGWIMAELYWRFVMERPGEPDFTFGTTPPLCPREYVGRPRKVETTPRRPLLIACWQAIRGRAVEMGVTVPPADPDSRTTEELVEDVHEMELAIARAARLKGERAWPSQTAS